MKNNEKNIFEESMKYDSRWKDIFKEINRQKKYLQINKAIPKKIILGKKEYLTAIKELYKNQKIFLVPERLDDLEICLIPIESCIFVISENNNTLDLIL